MSSGLLVWWLTQADCEAIGDELPGEVPEYIREEYKSRRGRVGRGRIWVSRRFADVSIDPWPDTPLAKHVGEKAGGIVVCEWDSRFLSQFPGIVTDTTIRRVGVDAQAACIGMICRIAELRSLLRDIVDDSSPCTTACHVTVGEGLIERAKELLGP